MIYFIQSGENGPIKIGYTKRNDVSSRVSNLQVSNPENLKLLACIEGSEFKENDLHKTFAEHRIRGEWFHPHESIFDLLKSTGESFCLSELAISSPDRRQVITSHVSVDDWKSLCKVAVRQNKSPNQILREIIHQFIENPKLPKSASKPKRSKGGRPPNRAGFRYCPVSGAQLFPITRS